MTHSPIRVGTLVVATLTLAVASLNAASNRQNSIDRFGVGGYIQPIGLHHGFHIERVLPDSPADFGNLLPHDVIVKIDGEAIRSIDHLRAALAEAYADDGEASITYIRGASLTHHELNCNVKKSAVKAVGTKRRSDEDDAVR